MFSRPSTVAAGTPSIDHPPPISNVGWPSAPSSANANTAIIAPVDRLISRLSVHGLVEAAAAHLAVDGLAFDRDLGAFEDALAGLVDARIHGRLATARADVLDLFQAIGQRQQIDRARKRLAREIAPQAVADDRHAQHVGGAKEL